MPGFGNTGWFTSRPTWLNIRPTRWFRPTCTIVYGLVIPDGLLVPNDLLLVPGLVLPDGLLVIGLPGLVIPDDLIVGYSV